MGGESSFRPASGFGRVGGDRGYAKMGHGSAKLSQVALINLAASFWGMPVMTTAIRVETAEQAADFNDILYTLEAADRPFLGAEEQGVVLIGGIIHSADKIPLLTRHPLMGAAVLMDHHAGKG